MTQVIIQDIIPRTQLTSTGGQTVFNTNWTADEATDIDVYARAQGIEPDDATQLVSPSDYNVTFVGGSETVRVTFLVGRVLGDVITIVRNTPATRTNLYINTNFVPSMLNQDFGILTLVDQQAQMYDTVVNPGYNVSATIDNKDKILPILGAQQVWRMNEDNTGFEAYTIDTTPVPSNSYFLTYGDDPALENEQNLALLGDGLLKQTVSGGFATLALAIPNVDYLPGNISLGTMAYQDANAVNITGGSAALTSGSVAATPFNPTDLVNKAYADAVGSGFTFKAACFAGTTANLSTTYNNGASGVGATLTATVNGVFSVDGVSPTVNQRILVKDQSTTAYNGIYTVTDVGSAGTPYVLTRATDFDSSAEIVPGSIIFVTNGTVNAQRSWVETNGVITVGTDPIVFVVFSQTYPLSLANGGTGAVLTASNNSLVVGTASAMAFLATANSGVLVTSAGGVPSISTTLPAGLTIPGYATSGANANITSMTGLTGYLQYPAGVKDSTGAVIVTFSTNGVTPVNYIDIVNNPTGSAPGLRAMGADTNVTIGMISKGTGQVQSLSANTTTPILWTTGTGLQHNTSWAIPNTAASRTVTLQDLDGTMAYLADRGWVLVSTATASSSAVVDFTNLATYNNYCVIFQSVTPATNAVNFLIQASINNGSTFLNGASDNLYQSIAATNTSISGSSGTLTYIPLAAPVTNLAGGGAFGLVYIGNVLNVSTKKGVVGDCSFYTAASPPSCYLQRGQFNTTSVVNALRFAFTSGNIANGNFYLYGLK